MEDLVHAFTPYAPLGDYGSAQSGPMSDLRFAVKDLFDVAGFVTGAGTPAWAQGRAVASHDALVVAKLRTAGAAFVGKTITDELAWSLGGENIHYGAPINTAAPDRVTGGSSSGSAAAVAAGLADIALGTDTGGSIRLPASYTGLWGIRTTHGRLSLDGVVPLAPSYDTVGWFARDADTFARMGPVMFGSPQQQIKPNHVLIAQDAFASIDSRYADRLNDHVAAILEVLNLPCSNVTLAPDGLSQWRETFKICQAAEAWETHGAWISETRPNLSADISDRFAAASKLSQSEIHAARVHRNAITKHMADLLDGGCMILMPTAAPPHRRGLSEVSLAKVRQAAIELLCPASHAGIPQLTFPAMRTAEGPVGLSLLGARGTDMQLLDVGRNIQKMKCS